ncbi:MAG TPA: hypothetical protein VFA29_14800 [Candidatus Baltobacteraceae bacterium]|nr:hypothetical protein [Candidatus Baltobacteraceae bacterium]
MFFLAVSGAPCNIHPVYVLTAVTAPVSVTRTGSKYQASSRISFRIKETRSAVIVSVEPGVLEHVRGHQLIAQRVARSSSGRITAAGSTAAQARAGLARSIRDLTADQNRELLREEHVYDTVTENGAAQSQGPSYGMPGGSDVQDRSCTQ